MVQCIFLTDILDLVYLHFALNAQRVHLSTELGCWDHLEKLVEMFLNTFHREHILLKLKTKNLLRKIRSKNLTAGV